MRGESRPPLYIGEVVQVDPRHDARFGGCLLIVREIKPWGVVGDAIVPGNPRSAIAPYRAPWHAVELVGPAHYRMEDAPDDAATPPG